MANMRWFMNHKIIVAAEAMVKRDPLNITLAEAKSLLIKQDPLVLQYQGHTGIWIDVPIEEENHSGRTIHNEE